MGNCSILVHQCSETVLPLVNALLCAVVATNDDILIYGIYLFVGIVSEITNSSSYLPV
jgi:hypothetical protein